ncbi:hypothetical protein ABES28_08340 [Bacillus licheniformis]|uniref:Uncharacterized protein n=4 Tax=Bacillus licheniformis TaxID=1402 RepID=A0AB37GLW9_BACLI|nr:hypothetical protein [Bacillus licheniformis]MBW7632592.1 hypothetical protein [Bacillus licheniformis]MDH3163800.1 hypothetical protein [Bacillus licheniformis]MED4409592.1 hypothetical protein [Bacillus licheniformis]QDL80029.1 hypothetical protein D9Y32_22705 [Bacillus licheniformis]QPR71101.1 hypothetical protein I6G80_14750 [Bacillus licheniformis]
MIYRDIIYFNADKIQSILAQLNKGVVESLVETKERNHEVEGIAKTSKVLEFLGFPFSTEGNYRYNNAKGLQEEKILHDFALTELLKILPCKDASKLDRSQLGRNDRVFVKVKGKLSIYDYRDLKDTLEKVGAVAKLINSEEQSKSDLNDFAEFIGSVYSDLMTIEIRNQKEINFIGAVNSDFLRETMRNMVYKYGSKPIGDWEMICQITRLPKNRAGNLEDMFRDFGKDINTENLGKEKSLERFLNEILKEFSKINDMFASVSYPNIAVEPIAVYQEINIKK